MVKDYLVFYFVMQKWVPLHGYKRAAAEKEKNWIIEVPQNADPYVDRFELQAKNKQEKVAKNEFQRLRNLAASKSIKVPRVGLPPTDKLNSDQVSQFNFGYHHMKLFVIQKRLE